MSFAKDDNDVLALREQFEAIFNSINKLNEARYHNFLNRPIHSPTGSLLVKLSRLLVPVERNRAFPMVASPLGNGVEKRSNLSRKMNRKRVKSERSNDILLRLQKEIDPKSAQRIQSKEKILTRINSFVSESSVGDYSSDSSGMDSSSIRVSYHPVAPESVEESSSSFETLKMGFDVCFQPEKVNAKSRLQSQIKKPQRLESLNSEDKRTKKQKKPSNQSVKFKSRALIGRREKADSTSLPSRRRSGLRKSTALLRSRSASDSEPNPNPNPNPKRDLSRDRNGFISPRPPRPPDRANSRSRTGITRTGSTSYKEVNSSSRNSGSRSSRRIVGLFGRSAAQKRNGYHLSERTRRGVTYLGESQLKPSPPPMASSWTGRKRLMAREGQYVTPCQHLFT